MKTVWVGLLGFLLLFVLSFSIFNNVQQTGITMEFESKVGSAKMQIESDNDELVRDLTYSFLIASILMLIITSITLIKFRKK